VTLVGPPYEKTPHSKTNATKKYETAVSQLTHIREVAFRSSCHLDNALKHPLMMKQASLNLGRRTRAWSYSGQILSAAKLPSATSSIHRSYTGVSMTPSSP